MPDERAMTEMTPSAVAVLQREIGALEYRLEHVAVIAEERTGLRERIKNLRALADTLGRVTPAHVRALAVATEDRNAKGATLAEEAIDILRALVGGTEGR